MPLCSLVFSHETNRLIEGTAQNIKTSGLIGGDLEIQKDAPFLQERLELFNTYYEAYQKSLEGRLCVSPQLSLNTV